MSTGERKIDRALVYVCVHVSLRLWAYICLCFFLCLNALFVCVHAFCVCVYVCLSVNVQVCVCQ